MSAPEPPALIERIRDRSVPITVWGAGFIGISAAAAFVEQGYSCTIVDIDPARVALVNQGILPLGGFDDRIRLDPDALITGRLRAVPGADPAALAAPVQIVCVNTDRADLPFADPLLSVLKQIADASAGRGESLVVIESTVSIAWLGSAESLLTDAAAAAGGRVHLATAPRRDWLLSADKNLRTLPRIIGTLHPGSRDTVTALYDTVSENIELAPDWLHSGLVKPVENLFRFVDLVLTNQLATAYPSLDMAEVLRLAGTKWNVNTFHPSVGLGGYCIPIAPHYVGAGLIEDGLLPLAAAAVEWNGLYPALMAERLLKRCPGPIGVLGVSYAPDVRIPQGSPGLALAAELAEFGAQVRIHDPYFLADELSTMSSAPPLRYPDDLDQVGTLIVVTPHSAYADLAERLSGLTRPPLVVDSLGTLRAAFAGTALPYLEVGTPVTAAGLAAASGPASRS